MAKIPDYLIIEYDSKTTEESIEVKVVENGISLGMVAGISVGIVAGLLFFCILGILFFFIKKKPHREVQKRSIYRGK